MPDFIISELIISEIELGSNFQLNLMSWGVKLSWGVIFN